ncbi:hypothetical protein [Legionella nagasakiensis]|uniref:hypothetical protein n=1 Tax=Legionella nagasakiensis TaxID=535290 RepID=UPI001056CE9A|nr:hypothetical protein [Legionella nagasakiensis]
MSWLGAGLLVGLGGLQYGAGQVVAAIKRKVAGDPKGVLPKDQEQFLKDYAESMGFGKGLPGSEAFQTYMDGRTKGAEGFAAVKAVDDKTFGTLLQEAEADHKNAVDAIKEDIDSVLAVREDTTTAQKAFKDEIAAIHRAIADPKFRYDPAGLAARLHEIKNDAHRAIEAQQKAENAQLEDKFKKTPPSEFRTHLQTIGMTEKQIDELHDSMKAALKESHDKELETFDKTMNERLTKLHQEAQLERDRIHFLAALYQNNETMRRVINEMAEQNRKPKGTAGITAEFSASENAQQLQRVILKGINVRDIENLQTVTGRPLNKIKDGYSMEFPNRLSSPFYYGGWNSKLKSDMMSMVLAIKASGYETITMSLNHKDPKHADEMARKAYEACLEAGYKDDEITIKVNGKQLSAEEVKGLYKDFPSRLKAVQLKVEKYDEQREGMTTKLEGRAADGAAREFKEALKAHREREAAVPADDDRATAARRSSPS